MFNIDIIKQVAELVDKYGFVLIFAIISAILNFWLIVKLIRGTLVPASMYIQMRTERDKMQKALDNERKAYLTPLIKYIGKLKRNEEGNSNDSNT